MEHNVAKGLGRGREPHRGAGLVGFTHDSERRLRHTMRVGLLKQLAFSSDSELKARGQRVHHGNAHTVQASGDFVGVIVKLTARVQDGHDHLCRRDAFFVLFSGNTAPVIRYCDRFIWMNHYINLAAMSRQRFVDAVVDQLENHVVQPGPVIGITDVHAGALAHGVQALKHLDAGGVVIPGFRVF